VIHSNLPLTRLSAPGVWTLHCYFDISPESPDGSRVTCFSIADDKSSGQTLVVDADGSNRRGVGGETATANVGMWHHAGARQQWIDNRRIIHNRLEAGGAAFSEVVEVDSGQTVRMELPVRMVNPVAPVGITSSHEAAFGGASGEPPAVFRVDLTDGRSEKLFDIEDIRAIHPQAELAARYDMRIKHTKWSPDGRMFFLVYNNEHLRRTGQPYDRIKSLVLADADGGNLRYLTEFGHHPMWSPDGADVLAYSGSDLVALPAGGGPMRTLLAGAPGVHGSLDPTGTTLVTDLVPGESGGEGGVLTIDLASGRQRTLATFTHPPIEYEYRVHPHPAWSRNGRRVYFNAVDDGVAQVFAVDLGA